MMRGGSDDDDGCDNDDNDDDDDCDHDAYAVHACLRFSDATARWSVEPTPLKHPHNRSECNNNDDDGDYGDDDDDTNI